MTPHFSMRKCSSSLKAAIKWQAQSGLGCPQSIWVSSYQRILIRNPPPVTHLTVGSTQQLSNRIIQLQGGWAGSFMLKAHWSLLQAHICSSVLEIFSFPSTTVVVAHTVALLDGENNLLFSWVLHHTGGGGIHEFMQPFQGTWGEITLKTDGRWTLLPDCLYYKSLRHLAVQGEISHPVETWLSPVPSCSGSCMDRNRVTTTGEWSWNRCCC